MSSVTDRLRREQIQRFAKMTPAQRLILSEKLGREGLLAFMSAHKLDRRTALIAIRRSRRVGRRPSDSADAER